MFNSLNKRFKRWKRKISLTKRQEFVIATSILTIGLILTQVATLEWRYPMVVALSLLAFIVSAISLREDLSGVEWLTLLLLPTLFTGAVALFYFLLPVRWLTRLPVGILYAIGMYALLLTENIYNVAALRSIALLRAAHSVGFLLSLVTYFLLISTIFSFRLPLAASALLVWILSFLLSLQSLWAIGLDHNLIKPVWQIATLIAFFLTELSWVFGFWPVKSTLVTLFLTTCFYSSVGMGQQYLSDRLYKKTIVEFLSVALLVLAIILIATRWRGNF